MVRRSRMSATSVVPKARVISVRSVVSVHWRSDAALDLEDEHPDMKSSRKLGSADQPASAVAGTAVGVGRVKAVGVPGIKAYNRSERQADDGLPSHPGYPLAMMLRILAA